MTDVPIFEDLILTRDKVQPGDQLLRDSGLVLVLETDCFGRDWDGIVKLFTEIRYRQDDGREFSSDWPSDQLEAVRREVKPETPAG